MGELREDEGVGVGEEVGSLGNVWSLGRGVWEGGTGEDLGELGEGWERLGEGGWKFCDRLEGLKLSLGHRELEGNWRGFRGTCGNWEGGWGSLGGKDWSFGKVRETGEDWRGPWGLMEV